jgi:ATP-dependent DNA helicase RecQ
MVRGFAETPGCRRDFLLGYFGEQYDAPCGACDRCADGVAGDTDDGTGPWRTNDRVTHDVWGEGVVMRTEPDRVTVLFERAGYKTLRLDAVQAAEVAP